MHFPNSDDIAFPSAAHSESDLVQASLLLTRKNKLLCRRISQHKCTTTLLLLQTPPGGRSPAAHLNICREGLPGCITDYEGLLQSQDNADWQRVDVF